MSFESKFVMFQEEAENMEMAKGLTNPMLFLKDPS